MEVDNKRHGKKSDKETQSPVLKVFKEMIQRENRDPEKANLLKEKQENRKRRQYSGSRSKSDRNQRSCDSSSSEKQRRSVQYKVGAGIHEQKIKDYNHTRSQSTPFQGEKKDSWWFWGETEKKSEDTCSCVSCALKKIASSEYTCIACLGVLFLISVLVAFMVLFKAVPVPLKDKTPVKKREMNSDALKKKIEMLQRGYGGEFGGSDRRLWDDTMTRHLSSLTGLTGNDFDDSSYRENNALEESVMRSDSELSSVLDTDKLNDGLSSERLRNFYRKLIQTDAQIRSLKKGLNDESLKNIDESKYDISDRAKRSLKLKRPKSLLRFNSKKEAPESKESLHRLHKFNLFYPPFYAVNSTKKKKQCKRYVNGTSEPTGFLIEKKQILVQYKPRPNLKKVPKCSHAPKEGKSHEKLLKHPFYKNTQRLDELLDQFLDKNLPEMMVDPFGVDVLFKKGKEFQKTHKTNLKIEGDRPKKIHRPTSQSRTSMKVAKVTKAKSKAKPKIFSKPKKVKEKLKDKLYSKPKMNKEFFDMVTSRKRLHGVVTPSTPAYDVLLSVSTIVNPTMRKVVKAATMSYTSGRTPSLLERVPHVRKLMQFDDEDDEGLGYEDLKEVLADENETHDDTDGNHERLKRMEEDLPSLKFPSYPSKYNPPGVHNPNWKGPMPLYPDELSSMIKQAAIKSMKRVVPINSKDVSGEVDEAEGDLSDVEYIENYSDNKFDKLVKMAQAYSDYGVLEGKKELVRNENKPIDGKGVDRIVKLSVNKGKSLKKAVMNRFKKRKCAISEGIRFELRPTTTAREDPPIEIFKALQKHVKVANPQQNPYSQIPGYTLFSATVEKPANPTPDQSNQRAAESPKMSGKYYTERGGGVVVTLQKGSSRNLKSVADNYFNADEEIIASEIFAETTTAKEEEFELADKSLTFVLRKGKSPSNVERDFDESFNEMNVIKIGKRSLKSVESSDDENKSDAVAKTNHSDQFLVNQNSDSELSIELEAVSNISKDEIVKVSQKRDVLDKKLEKSTEHSNNITSNITKSNYSFGFFEDNNIFNALLSTNRNVSSSEMDFAEFFRIMANWFGLLAQSENVSESTTTQKEAESNIIKFTTTKLPRTTPVIKKTNDVQYPMYDSDMIENIGHRSRVLLAFDETHDNSSTESVVIGTSPIQDARKYLTSTEVTSSIEMSTSTGPILAMIPKMEPNLKSTILIIMNDPASTAAVKVDAETEKRVEHKENKTVVKRNIPEDSNLIFWNDMYDDEYGIKLDPIDAHGPIRDKHNVKGMDFVRKSGNWIQDKMRSLASNFHRDRIVDDGKARLLRGAKFVRSNPYPKRFRNRYVKRDVKLEDDELEEPPSSFTALTAKMKSVCKEAARAVQQTRNIKVRQNDQEETVAASLMQQLVKLMTDLIDFQVKQKTCAKLPPDLQDFLGWLTAPNSESLVNRNSKFPYQEDNLHGMDKSIFVEDKEVNALEKPSEVVIDLDTTPSSEREEIRPDSRSDCLGTLHAVQDLMQQFDDMADEDKSKMTGIREYLENQLQFLNKQLTSYDEYMIPNMFDEQNPSLRFRRDVTTNSYNQRKHRNRMGRKRRFKRKFLKNFGKKHTRTTASIYDGYPITEMSKRKKNKEESNEKMNLDGKAEVKIEKRNLKDVYYKALLDAKTSTTCKVPHKQSPLDGFDNAQIVRIEN